MVYKLIRLWLLKYIKIKGSSFCINNRVKVIINVIIFFIESRRIGLVCCYYSKWCVWYRNVDYGGLIVLYIRVKI